jgi:hypothetical protein
VLKEFIIVRMEERVEDLDELSDHHRGAETFDNTCSW